MRRGTIMAQYDDPEFDPEEFETVKAQAVVLGDGMVTLYLPKDWQISEHEFLKATLVATWLDGARLDLRAWSYEGPEEIGRNALAHFVTGPDLPPLSEDGLVYDENGAPDYEGFTQRAGGFTLPDPGESPDVQEAFRIWRRIAILRPDHVRVIEARLFMPPEEAESEAALRIRNYLDQLMPETVFSNRTTAADRIAPTPELRKFSVWNTIYMRVPADWPDPERANQDGTGRYVFDDKGPDSKWTLWIDYVVYGDPGDGHGSMTAAEFAAKIADRTRESNPELDNVWVDPMPDRPDQAVVKTLHYGVEDGEPLCFMNWYVITHTSDRPVTGQFSWVLTCKAMNDPDIVALTELVEAEVLKAVILDPDAGKLAPSPQGSA